MVRKLEPQDPDLSYKAIDDFGIWLIRQVSDKEGIALRFSDYLFGSVEYPVQKKQVMELFKRYDCEAIITIDKVYKAAEKFIEEYTRKSFYRKIYEESRQKKAGGAPPEGE